MSPTTAARAARDIDRVRRCTDPPTVDDCGARPGERVRARGGGGKPSSEEDDENELDADTAGTASPRAARAIDCVRRRADPFTVDDCSSPRRGTRAAGSDAELDGDVVGDETGDGDEVPDDSASARVARRGVATGACSGTSRACSTSKSPSNGTAPGATGKPPLTLYPKAHDGASFASCGSRR